ncbi:MAG: carboxypeptidase-like regulatory domain-containing protein [Phycisphaerales bacterium]|jgi:protocatechuate 3,4-dioxygenase beta subunit|nr:carboxypeptidase-like regulatory domain-containing protein [Phycisphaerales bacterium]
MNRLSVLAVCAALAAPLALASGSAPGASGLTPVAQPAREPGQIAVNVKDADGNPVAGAQVRLATPQGLLVARGETNERGRVLLRPVRPGRYIVQGAKREVGADREAAVASAGEVTIVDLTLEKR